MDEIGRIERRIKLHDVRVLMAVVQAGSMGKAAEQLGTSQPAVSRSISDLEHALKVRLLDRSSRGIEPTPFGHALFNRGLAVFDELRQGIKDIEFLADPTVGEVRIGASIAVAAGFVSAVIGRLSRRYPRVTFQVMTGDTATAYRALEDRNVDVAVAHVIDPVSEDRMNMEVLCHEPHVVVAGINNPWCRQRKLKLADLMHEPWTLPQPDSPFGAIVSEAFRSHGLVVPQAVATSSLPVRNALVATGRFLSIAPRVVTAFSATNPGLRCLPVNLPTTRRPLAVVTLRNRTLSAVAQLFINCAQEVAKPLAHKK